MKTLTNANAYQLTPREVQELAQHYGIEISITRSKAWVLNQIFAAQAKEKETN